jgi:hypothetical protein
MAGWVLPILRAAHGIKPFKPPNHKPGSYVDHFRARALPHQLEDA